MTKYSGNMMADLDALIEDLREAEKMLKRDPFAILADVKTHLCDREMTAGETSAWWEINDAMERLIADETAKQIANETQGEHMLRTGLDNWLQRDCYRDLT